MSDIFRHPSVVTSGTIRHEDVEKKLCSHVADLVIFDKNYGKVPHILKFDGVLLFADVSGFTALTERYTMSSEKGTDALTVTLNGYIGKIVEYILHAGGDILKFAGDAILAVWKVKQRSDLKHAISQAAKCSLAIQDKCDNQETDVGVKLRVKIAISAGKIFATFVGNEEVRHFVMAGRPIKEVNDAEKYCEAGLVVLSPNGMELSDKENIITDPLSERFGLVRHLRREPRKEWHEYVDLPMGLKFTKHADRNIRMCLGIRSDPIRERVVRKYISPVVQRKLDDDQPLKYLSEMRQCSILFINLAFDLSERDRQFHEKQCANMQQSFNIVHGNITDRQGSLNKIFMFDKGCTFLVIFGLPGDKHEQEPAHALQAAWNINQELRETIPTLSLASFGVTTGPVFCGVIGHAERHEYTVIGQKVNLAARLMMHYPNHVSCDFETYNNSKLSKDMFSRLPHRAMKGVGDIVVYDYTEGERKPAGTTTVLEPEYPIIGRFEEIEIFMTELRQLRASKSLGLERRVIVFEGEAGYGKTRVMQEIQWRAGLEGARVIAFTLSINDLNSPFFAVKTLIELLLAIEGCKDRIKREKALLSALDKEDHEYLCLLNGILLVQFPIPNKLEHMDDEIRTRALHGILVKIVQKVTANQFVLFALDDAQNVDSDSWDFITTLSKDSRALCVITMRPFSPDKPPCESAKQVLYHPKTMYVKLRGLMNEHLTPLACQFLEVERIPLELEMILMQRSYGVPLWCEQLIREMHTAGILLIIPMTDRHLNSDDRAKLPGSQTTFDYSRHRPSVGVADKSLLRRRKESYFETSVSKKVSESIAAVPTLDQIQEETKTVVEPAAEITVTDSSSVDKPETLKRNKPSLTSWTDRVKWKNKVDTADFLTSEPSTATPIKVPISETKPKLVAMECVVKPNFDLNKFPVPASIRGMALTRLDRMKPFEQLIVKCAAVVGGNASNHMLRAIVPGYQEEKFRKAIYQLMRSRVFECASTVSASDERELNRKRSIQLGGMAPCITCTCHGPLDINQTANEDEAISNKCEQYKFRNSLVQETAYQLWLQDQRRSLHEACACYLEGKINEVLITGTTDNVVTKQFKLSRKAGTHWTHDGKETSSMLTLPTIVEVSEETDVSDGDEDVMKSTIKIQKEKGILGVPEGGQRRLSRCSVIGRMDIDSIGARKSANRPLVLQVENMPGDYAAGGIGGTDVDFMNGNAPNSSQTVKPDHFKVSQNMDTLKQLPGIMEAVEGRAAQSGRKMSLGPMWSQAVGLTPSFERVIHNTEEQAKILSALTLQKVLRTPFEIQDTLSLLYSQLVYHWQKASNTEKTIECYLKAAESSIATMSLTAALQYLKNANKIVDNLDKGLDIISNFTEDDDLNLDDIKVLSVGRETKAKIQSLLGQVLFQQGHLEEALPHFFKALKILHCKLVTNKFLIWVRTMYEKQLQRMHIKKPSKYIGSASSKHANIYAEQVRCLSYVWQILLNNSNFPNRIQLSKLVVLMQLNRAEAADDDLQELITAYTYMMQFQHIDGDLSQSVYYENRATARCLDLPKKLTSPDLYIVGHLQLVSCSVRLSYGKLAYATTSGYRAYNIADSLGDTHIKFIVLPLLAQIHMMTSKGRACIEVLQILKTISKQNFDDIGLSMYYSLCFDLILDGGFMSENATSCVEFLQSTESLDIGDIPRYYIRTSMAVWCYRREETFKGRAWLELSAKIMPSHFDNFMSARAFTRMVESRLLALRKYQESFGISDKQTKQAFNLCSKALNRFEKLCKQFPVFYPRFLHFNAYFYVLYGNIQKSNELVSKSIEMARYCGNTVDQKWAEHSKKFWFSAAAAEDPDYWVKNSLDLPKWEMANQNDHIEWNFTFKPVESYLTAP